MNRLRRRCERRLRGIRIPQPFDIDEFCAVVAGHRGRRLTVQPLPGLAAAAPCGLWVSLPAADYVFFDPGTSRLHAEHIILHELGHILSGHSTGVDVPGSTLARLMPDLAPETIGHVLGRVSYSTTQEREAELLASLIRARAVAGSPRRGDAERGGALDRMADALSFEPPPR